MGNDTNTNPAANFEIVTSIPLGGNLKDYAEENEAFIKVDTSSWTDAEATNILLGYYVYASRPDYNIAVYRLPDYKDGAKTVAVNDLLNYYSFSDEVAESLLAKGEKDGTEYYSYTSTKKYLETDVYYSQCVYFEDGNDVSALFFSAKCEKTPLGDTGLSAWLPVDSGEYTEEVPKLESETLLKTLFWDEEKFPVGSVDILTMENSDDAIEQVRSLISAQEGFVSMTDTTEIQLPDSGLTAVTFDAEMDYSNGNETVKTCLIENNGKLVRITVWENDITAGAATGLFMGIVKDN